MSWHDTDFAGTWSNDTGTVWSEESSFVLSDEGLFDSDHILLWDTFGDAGDEWDFGFDSFEDSGGGHRWWNMESSLGIVIKKTREFSIQKMYFRLNKSGFRLKK